MQVWACVPNTCVLMINSAAVPAPSPSRTLPYPSMLGNNTTPNTTTSTALALAQQAATCTTIDFFIEKLLRKHLKDKRVYKTRIFAPVKVRVCVCVCVPSAMLFAMLFAMFLPLTSAVTAPRPSQALYHDDVPMEVVELFDLKYDAFMKERDRLRKKPKTDIKHHAAQTLFNKLMQDFGSALQDEAYLHGCAARMQQVQYAAAPLEQRVTITTPFEAAQQFALQSFMGGGMIAASPSDGSVVGGVYIDPSTVPCYAPTPIIEEAS